MPATPDWLRRKVEAGELGHKTGKGIYAWKDGKPVKAAANPAPNTEMTDRLILPMVNVCVACLREGIVENPDIVDGAMVRHFNHDGASRICLETFSRHAPRCREVLG